MDPNTSIGRLCLGENNQGFVAEGIENKEQWEGPEFQDTASSGQDKEAKVFTFYRMEEEGERYFTPCYVGGLHTYDGEINLKYEENLISNEFTIKFFILEEERPVIETMAYSDKNKKILDVIVMDKIKLDGEIKKERIRGYKACQRRSITGKGGSWSVYYPDLTESKNRP
ncbi:hypothetical protein Tco_1231954 [Tanacetum coccineum]